eukprot:gene9740-6828_t
MSVLVDTGDVVAPGDTLFMAASNLADAGEPEAQVHAGEGCYVCYTGPAGPSPSTVERRIVSSALGVAQWDGDVISVYARPLGSGTAGGHKRAREAEAAHDASEASLAAARVANVLGPRPRDVVHARITRVTRTLVISDVMAINGQWCRHSSSSSSAQMAAFRGVLRLEDIRPFHPSKDQMQPPPPSASFAPGDVVVAVVLSQSDVRQYQLSTVEDHCGVVKSVVRSDGDTRVALLHVPGRRDIMRHPLSNAAIPRWCPLIPL